MIHKIKVVKELPGVKVGDEFALVYPFWLGEYTLISDEFMVNKLVKGGWIKVITIPISEKPLARKFMDAWGFTQVDLDDTNWIAERVMECVEIAKEHTLKVYDKKTKGNRHLNYVDSVREEIENSFDEIELIPKPRRGNATLKG